MTKWKTYWIGGALAVAATPLASAQDSVAERAEAARRAEAALLEAREVEREARTVERAARAETVDIEHELREAELRMAEAARRIAELSTRRLPRVAASNWTVDLSGKPVLGITIGAPVGGGPVEGVVVLGVSPGGAAEEAGLRARDVITAVNGESLSADTSEEASKRLLDFMAGVEEGDTLDVEYLRAGRSASTEVSPRPVSPQVFSFDGPESQFRFMVPRVRPDAPADMNSFVVLGGNQGWGDMEMVKLTEGLGRYFGTEEGLLVVRAPNDETFQLQDGDVILDIDGRKPASVSHAIRILGSYHAGENLKIRIMRDQRARTLEIEMPDNRRGAFERPWAPRFESEVTVVPRIRSRSRSPDVDERI